MSQYRFRLRERLADFREWVDGRSPWRFELVLLACLVVGLTALICSEYLPSLRGFSEGNGAPRTVVAGKTVTVLDAEATEELRADVAALVEPVYVPDSEALPKATANLTAFLGGASRLRQELAGRIGVWPRLWSRSRRWRRIPLRPRRSSTCSPRIRTPTR